MKASESVSFDRAADYYDETRGFPPGEDRAAAALFARVGGLTSTARVLEVGIGTGRIALPLAAHVGLLAGIDISRPMLRRLASKRTDEPVVVGQGDVTRLPFAANTFDAVVAVHIYHLVAGWQVALREAARVLRPGGVLLQGFNDGARHRFDTLWAAWNEEVGPQDQTANVGVPRAQYQTFLEDEGWQPVAGPESHTFIEPRSVGAFVDQLERRVWSSLWRVPDDVWARGVAAVRAAVVEQGLDPAEPLDTTASFTVRAYRPPAS